MAAKHPFSAIPFNTVVYLGAGYGDRLKDLVTQINAKHWHLVEGDSKKHKSLQQAINALQNSDNVTLHKSVVSDDGTTKTWYSYNLDEFSGLKKAKALDELFPGIQLKQEKSVETQALPELLSQWQLNSSDNNLLIIDLPGQALELMESILNAGQKPLFSQMVLTATAEQAFEQGGTLEQMKQWLDKQGYHTRNEPYDDPDFPVLYYSFDKHSAAEFAKLKKERDEAIARASDLETKLEESVTRASDLETKLEESVTRASGTSKELEQLQQNLAKATGRAEKAEAKAAEFETRLKDASHDIAQANEAKQKQTEWAHSLQTKLGEALAQATSTAKQLEQITKERDEQAHWHQKNKDWAHSLKKQLETLEAERDDLIKQLNGARKESEASAKTIVQRNQQLQEQTYRNQMLEREVAKLEAQVELVTDVVFRNKES